MPKKNKGDNSTPRNKKPVKPTRLFRKYKKNTYHTKKEMKDLR